MNPERQFLKALPPEFQAHRPKVRFFEKAVPNKELTEKDGRPRYDVRVYIEKIPAVSNYAGDTFHAPINEDYKMEFPDEWQKFLKAREQVANRSPSLMAIPGMDVASYEELKALELWDCELLANHSGALGELERFRTIARKIMEISNETGTTQRQAVRSNPERPAHNHLSAATGTIGFAGRPESEAPTAGRLEAGTAGRIQAEEESYQKEEKGQKEGFQKVGDFDLAFEVRQ